MKIQRTKPELQKRKGITLIEVVVVMIIIGLLVALTLPAINSSKRSVKKITCLNNMRNVGLAIINYSSTADSQLPLLVDQNTVPGMTIPATCDDLTWCTAILPFMDEVGFRQRWDSVASVAATGGSNMELQALNANRFSVLTCPNDQYNTEPGALSFAVNIGYVMDGYNSPTDTSHYPVTNLILSTSTTASPTKFASGVFWRGGTDVPRMSLDFIAAADGIANTIMLSENLQAGNWSSLDTGSLGFGIDMEGLLPRTDSAETTTLNDDLILPADFKLKNLTNSTDSRISSHITAAKSSAWRPSSNHPSGIVNVVFCNGRGVTLSPQMDARVYARLLTPGGLRYGQAVVDESSY